jgi:hypothetical protein
MAKAKKSKNKRQKLHAKLERSATRMLRKSIERQVRLAYARIPREAMALNVIRLNTREDLVSNGYLTVEDLESLSRDAAIEKATRRVREQLKVERAARRG